MNSGCSVALVVDDDPLLRAITSAALLAELSLPNVQASGGAEALALLEEYKARIKLIVLDLNMPDRDGVEFILSISGANKKIPIIIMSGSGKTIKASAESLAKAHGVNVVAVLSKPVSLTELRSILRGCTASLSTDNH